MKKSLGPSKQTFPVPVYIVGTYNEAGEPNAMTVSGCGLCTSSPPCTMIAMSGSRYTYKNILKTNAFTVGFPRVDQVVEADYFGIASGAKENKFEKVNLTAVKSENVNAPVIEEFPMTLECKFKAEMRVGDRYIIIGEIVNVLADEDCLTEKGVPDINKMKPLAFNPAEYNYYSVGDFVADAFKVGLEIKNKQEGTDV